MAEAGDASRADILVVDDDPGVSALLATTLHHFGFGVHAAVSGREALADAARLRPAAILLDVMLPDIDGFEVCRQIRALGLTMPVLFVSGRTESEDRIRGLSAGGDDYVTEPFSMEEVVARLRAKLRRLPSEWLPRPLLTYRDLEIDDESHQVRRAGQLLELSPTEYKLLRYLLANAGRVVLRAQILDHVWGPGCGADTAVVTTYVSLVRRKVDSFPPPLVQTVRGIGYALRAPDADES